MKKEITDRFVGPNGEFVSTHKLEPGTISIGYCEELCEWIYYHNDLTNKEKTEQIDNMEGIVRNLLNKMSSFKINYIPTWSKKLEEKIKKEKNNLLKINKLKQKIKNK